MVHAMTGPNQLYSWDITHLPTGRPFEFWYLYALQDWFSRKVVSWLITDNLASDTAQDLWDQALINEGLLVKPQAEWPKSLSDRGTQMRAASTRRFFKRLGVDQLFARPRTPNDVNEHPTPASNVRVIPRSFVDRFLPVSVIKNLLPLSSAPCLDPPSN